MVHLLSFLSLHSSSPLPYPIPIPVSLIVGNHITAAATKLGCGYGSDYGAYSSVLRGKRRKNFQVSRASERDLDPFEIDQAKAHDALRMFDEQLRSYSKQQIRSPKIKASDLESIAGRDQITTESADDLLSGAFLGNLTFVLLLFTIFYNIFYFTVIEPTSFRQATAETEASERIPLMEF